MTPAMTRISALSRRVIAATWLESSAMARMAALSRCCALATCRVASAVRAAVRLSRWLMRFWIWSCQPRGEIQRGFGGCGQLRGGL